MRLTVVGCAGSYPGPDSAASSYLLEARGPDPDAGGERVWRLLVDLGSGALGSLQRHLDPVQLDGIVLSHLHADHCLDLCGLYVLRKYHPDGPQPRIPVWGPKDTARRMAKAYDLDEDPGMNQEFDFREHTASYSLGPFRVTTRRVAHPVTAYALRIEADGTALAYSGDTGPCRPLVEIARDADLFLCEASFLESSANPPDLHLTGAEAGAAATAAGARRLLVTHVPPWHDAQKVLQEATTTYDGDVALAEPGRTYEL